MNKIRIQINKFQEIIPKFESFLKTEGQKWQKERIDKDEFLQTYFFNEEALNSLEEGTLRELLQKLWAFAGWTNKDYLLEEMLKSGLETIKQAFHILLFSNKSVAERFDHVKQNIRMMGATGISEILSHFSKKDYPIWSRRVRDGLIYLGISEDKLPKAAQISGSQYESLCEIAKEVLNQLQTQRQASRIDDLFGLDFLLFFISIEKPEQIPIKDFEHDVVVEQVLELGDGLGFEVEKEVNVARGCRIDALWRSRIANLGVISYAFEVHRRGSRDSAILNLQKIIKQDPSIQKVILVSSVEELEAFRLEISFLGEDFRNAVGYFHVEDLQHTLSHLELLKSILKNVGLLDIKKVF
ncbi:MAG: hypothetical protein AVO34_11350 [Firmicutes bacterium ML8_F2]|jgi:hypothetical protein|nr:MAG: hypothetical protein AVO34_11350 [Firmicutes bacterium ML8_F2]